MIKELDVFSAQPGAPELSLGDLLANQDSLQVRDITGLGPVKADIASTPLSTRGVLLQGISVGARNIVITLGLNPDWIDYTVAGLRQLLYRYFLPEQWVKLRFTSDELPVVDIEGYVESTEPNIFADDPEVQVSILCPRPDFIDPVAHEVTGIVQVEDETGVPVSHLYEGTIDTGFELLIGDEESDQTFEALDINISADLENPDQWFQVVDLEITNEQYYLLNTTPGAKKAVLVSWFDGAEINYLRKSSAVQNKWPRLRPGMQDILIADSSIESSTVPWKLAYYNRFAGF